MGKRADLIFFSLGRTKYGYTTERRQHLDKPISCVIHTSILKMCVNRFFRNIGSQTTSARTNTPDSVKVSAMSRRKLEMCKYWCASHVFSMVRDTVNLNNVLLGRTFYSSASACIWQINHSNDFNVFAALCKSTEQISKRQNRLWQATSSPDLPCFLKVRRCSSSSNTTCLKVSSTTVKDKRP